MAITNVHYVIRVSDLPVADALEGLIFFGYDPAQPLEDQSVQIPYTLFKDVFQGKLVNNDGTITLVELPDGTTEISAVTGDDGIQVDDKGGTKTLDVTAPVVSVESNAQINYIGFTSTRRIMRVINNSALQVIVSLGISGSGTDQILKDYDLDTLILPVGASVCLFKTAAGWRIIGLFGVSFFPDIVQGEDAAVLVKPNGLGASEDVKEFVAADETVTADTLTSADLENRFPDSVPGFKFICPNAGVIYTKVSDLAGWVKQNITIV